MQTTLPVVDSGLSAYLREIRALPMLTLDEEQDLAKRWVDHQDTQAAHRLVTSHLRLVAKIALGYRHYGLPVADLISEGNLGLMRAVKKFDPERGVRLATYALWWIKASLNEYVLNSWSMVRMGTLSAQKKLFFNLRRIKAKLSIMDAGDMSPANVQAIATELDVPKDDVIAMNRRMIARDTSLNVPVGENGIEIQNLIVDSQPNQETALAQSEELGLGNTLIAQALDQLDERERDIFVQRRLSDAPPTLEELGAQFGVSRERIRQIEAKAFAKVQQWVLAGFVPTGQLALA